ncbi:hypothetical protein LguiA_023601 [Lonicera macranthoides]
MVKDAMKWKRFKDMVYIMKNVVVGLKPPDELTDEERELLRAAYNTLAAILRADWLKASSQEKELADKLEDISELLKVRDRILAIEAETAELCDNGILKSLKEKLEPSAATSESKIYYLRMRGDLCKLLVRIKSGGDVKKVTDEAFEAYLQAQSW